MEIVSTGHPRDMRHKKKYLLKAYSSLRASVIDMLKLGNQIKRTTTGIEIYNFDFQAMAWSASPVLVDLNIEDTAFGAGRFREAFKATSKHKEYLYATWVATSTSLWKI